MSHAAPATHAQPEAGKRMRQSYVIRESAISAVINALLSIGFVELAFHGQKLIPAQGRHGSLLDLLPQTFMVVLMSLLVPNAVAETRLSKGELPWCRPRAKHTLLAVFALAVGTGVACSAAAWGLGWLLLGTFHAGPMHFGPFLLAKALYGGFLGAAITSVTLTRRFPLAEVASAR